MNESLVNFYTANGRDHQGRTFGDIMSFTDTKFESTHDFIQWIFPTDTISAYNKHAPLLDKETKEFLYGNSVFRERFQVAIQRFLNFLNLNFHVDHGQIFVSPIDGDIRHWMQNDNHNLLRMTRFMESCKLLGRLQTAI
jgi:hypothetical protein